VTNQLNKYFEQRHYEVATWSSKDEPCIHAEVNRQVVQGLWSYRVFRVVEHNQAFWDLDEYVH